jgi:Protein of unknown function (DUF998)
MIDATARHATLSKVPSSWAGATVLVGVALFIAPVVTLHLVQPGYEPSHQLMSELALGPFGWTMMIAFTGLALAVVGVHVAIAFLGASPWLRFVLTAAALSFLAAGIFPLGATSEIHIAAIATAFVLSVLAMYLFPFSAGRAAVAAPRSLSWPLAAGVAASVVLGHSALPMGVGQRLAALCLIGWLVILGWRFANGRHAAQQPDAADAQAHG